MTIRLEQVSISFPISRHQSLHVLQDISFTVNRGDFLIILGESGCGKSTLLNLIAGLTPATSGEIFINKTKITGPEPSRSILFQQPTLLPWLNVMDNIIFGCKLRNDVNNLEFRARLLIDVMGLTGFEKTYPSELSLGMAQRVCLARAMIGHPEILLLDEPFSALDTFTRTHLQQELLDFWQIEQFTGVFVTHDIDEALFIGNRIILLGDRPCRIVDQFEIKMNYPRDPAAPIFFKYRNHILKKFKEAVFNYYTFSE